jgi:ABC-type multidrug transport system fused ATPase/permease subunit
VGDFVSFLGAMLLVMAPLKRLTNINGPLQQGIAAGQSIFELLDTGRGRGRGGAAGPGARRSRIPRRRASCTRPRRARCCQE